MIGQGEMSACIFCHSVAGPFKSVEHIVPESLGNFSDRHVLPTGAVCDQCNNYFASSVEGIVLDHTSFRNLRAKYRVPSKKGRFPYVRGHARNTDIEVGMRLNEETQRLEFFAIKESQKADFERLKRLDALYVRPNVLVFPMTVDPPEKEMSRFLAKMAFESLYRRFALVEGPDIAREMVSSDHYDNIRCWARYGHNFRKWPYHYRAYFPEETLMEHPETKKWVQFGFGHDLLVTDHPETYFVFSYYGHEFTINLGGPSTKGYDVWLGKNNHVSFLVEKRGMYVQTLVEGDEEKHFLVPLLVMK
jgi:HNH endonuclease